MAADAELPPDEAGKQAGEALGGLLEREPDGEPGPGPRRARWARRLALPALDVPGARALFAASAIDAVGTGMVISFLLLYLTRVAGISLGTAGLALSLSSGVALAANPIAGSLLDRVGARPMLIASQILGVAGFLGLLLVESVPVLIAAAFLISLGERIFWVGFPGVVVGMAREHERDRWFAFAGMLREAGVGTGALLAGLIVWLLGREGYTVLMVANAVSFVGAGTLIALRVPRSTPSLDARSDAGGWRELLRTRPVMMMATANTAVIFCIMLTVLTLPIYAVDILDQGEWLPGVLLGINTAVLAVGQTVVLRIVGGWRRTRVLALASGVWILAAIAFAAALGVPDGLILPYLVASVVLAAMGDTLHGQMTLGLATALAPAGLQGRAIALFSLSWGLARTVAPSMVAGLLALGAAGPWALVVAFALAGAAVSIAAEPHIAPDRLRFPRFEPASGD